jgi:hypothetical protein
MVTVAVVNQWPDDCGDCPVRPYCWARAWRCALEDVASHFTPHGRREHVEKAHRIEFKLNRRFEMYAYLWFKDGWAGQPVHRHPVHVHGFEQRGLVRSLLPSRN